MQAEVEEVEEVEEAPSALELPSEEDGAVAEIDGMDPFPPNMTEPTTAMYTGNTRRRRLLQTSE